METIHTSVGSAHVAGPGPRWKLPAHVSGLKLDVVLSYSFVPLALARVPASTTSRTSTTSIPRLVQKQRSEDPLANDINFTLLISLNAHYIGSTYTICPCRGLDCLRYYNVVLGNKISLYCSPVAMNGGSCPGVIQFADCSESVENRAEPPILIASPGTRLAWAMHGRHVRLCGWCMQVRTGACSTRDTCTCR